MTADDTVVGMETINTELRDEPIEINKDIQSLSNRFATPADKKSPKGQVIASSVINSEVVSPWKQEDEE